MRTLHVYHYDEENKKKKIKKKKIKKIIRPGRKK